MNEMVDRVARAIASHPNAKLGHGLECGWDAMKENDRDEFRDDARAAINCGPTDAMCDAACFALSGELQLSREQVRRIAAAMIVAALKVD